MSSPTHVLEINNIDIYGRRFNGYSLTEYINSHPETNLTANFIVNHKLSNDHQVTKLFQNSDLEVFDWQIEEIEQRFGIKNQISISEDALINHPLYQKADILHFHMYHNAHFPIEFLTRIPPEKKIIIDIHDTFWLTDKRTPMLEVFHYADTKNKTSLDAQRKRVLNSIDAKFVAHSPYIINLAKHSSATKNLDIKLINFGINSDIFKPLTNIKKLRKKYHVPQTDLVLMCRSQKEFKGITYIESALQKLDLKIPITVLTINVKGLLDSLKSKYNILDFGNINTEEQMVELLNICDIFLAPSTEESFGFMAAEAMSCGKPVIVFEGTALPDTTHAPSIGIATKKSASALAAAIKHLAENQEERETRGKAGREFVLRHYIEQDYLNDYIKLFQFLSKIKARHLSKITTDLAPKNLQKFQQSFKTSLATSEVFDYNNIAIQTELQKYNSSLYEKIKRQSHRKITVNTIKRLVPRSIKLYIRKIQKGSHE